MRQSLINAGYTVAVDIPEANAFGVDTPGGGSTLLQTAALRPAGAAPMWGALDPGDYPGTNTSAASLQQTSPLQAWYLSGSQIDPEFTAQPSYTPYKTAAAISLAVKTALSSIASIPGAPAAARPWGAPLPAAALQRVRARASPQGPAPPARRLPGALRRAPRLPPPCL